MTWHSNDFLAVFFCAFLAVLWRRGNCPPYGRYECISKTLSELISWLCFLCFVCRTLSENKLNFATCCRSASNFAIKPVRWFQLVLPKTSSLCLEISWFCVTSLSLSQTLILLHFSLCEIHPKTISYNVWISRKQWFNSTGGYWSCLNAAGLQWISSAPQTTNTN